MANTTNAERTNQGVVPAITAGVTVTGSIECAAELQIGGQINGDVRCHTLFLEEGGVVTGDITAERVRVAGNVDGTIEAVDVAIEPTGKVEGTVIYSRLKVGAGGILEGMMKRRPGEAAPVESGNLKLVEGADPGKPRRVYVD